MLSSKQEKFFKDFLKRNSLKTYNDLKAPSVFFSLWKFNDIKKHRGFAVVIWRGSDILKMGKKLKIIKNMKNVYHVAISSYIAEDLEKYGVKYKSIPIVGSTMDIFSPYVMGNEIYTYVPSHHTNKYYKRYGMDVINKIKKKIKYKINVVKAKNQHSKKKLIKIYERCFCGLRMTEHDGLPNQVVEMGLMGRKSFYNGSIPDSIKWNEHKIDQIVQNIEKEAEKIGTIDYKHADKIKDYINVGQGWIDTDFWK